MSDSQSIVRLFPLPGMVLFPKAVLPLHIFEERYKQMVGDALNSDGRIAMALLKAGWVREYYGKPAIEPVVCVGRIVSYERLPAGQFNLLLQGTCRAVIDDEIGGQPYRQARIRPLRETQITDIDLSSERWRLQELFLQADLGSMGKHYSELVSSGLHTAEIADLLAFNLFENSKLKQSLLAERDVITRVRRIVDLLQDMIPMIRQAARTATGGGAMN